MFFQCLNHKYVYRFDPVPGTHKYKNGRSWRHMRTTQEKRITYGHLQDNIHIRGKRRPRSLPDVWDDYYISYMNKYGKSSSWKRNKKKKQYM